MLIPLLLILPIFALILTGYVMRRRRWLADTAMATLNDFVVRLALPVLLFDFVAEADWASLWQPRFLVALAGGMALSFAAMFALAPRTASTSARAIDGLAASYGNTAFLGIPVAQALLGPVGLAAAVIASLLTVVLLFALAILLIEIDQHRDRGARHAIRAVTVSLLRNPLVLGPLLGLAWALTGWHLPAPAHRFATLLGGTASPVALIAIGLFLGAPRIGGSSARIWPLVAMKLLGQPLLVFGLVRLLDVAPRWAAAAMLMAFLPTGTGPFMLANLYGQDATATARVILVTTLLSVVTIPLVAIAFG